MKIAKKACKDFPWCVQRYSKRFSFFQKSYGNTTRTNILYTQFFFHYSPGPREVSKSNFDSVRSEIFQIDSLETREFWWVKTPMGIQWFEVHRVWWWGGEEWRQKAALIFLKIYFFYSLRYCSTYISTPNVRVKVLWVYSYLKSDFF